MKIDKRKKYFITLDTETTNNNFESGFNDGLVYDLGFTITDKQGNIYEKRSFAIKEIFDWKELMQSAYYYHKLIWQARKIMLETMEKFGITEIYAYNTSFDITTLNNTIRYLSGSACRYFFKYGTKYCDIWHIACQVLGKQKTFQWENVRNSKNNLITNAERMFGYCEQIDFEEEHTALSDAIVESQILSRCLQSHQKVDKSINRGCWRICQKVA